MLILIIGALTIATLTVIFAIQNALIITISFLAWSFEGSLALVLLLTFSMGFIVGLLIPLPMIIEKSLISSDQRKRIEELERKLRERTDNPLL